MKRNGETSQFVFQFNDFVDYAQQRSLDPSLPSVIVNPNDPEKWFYAGNFDWYDFFWYVKNDIPLNLNYLNRRMVQSGHLEEGMIASPGMDMKTGPPARGPRYSLNVASLYASAPKTTSLLKRT